MLLYALCGYATVNLNVQNCYKTVTAKPQLLINRQARICANNSFASFPINFFQQSYKQLAPKMTHVNFCQQIRSLFN